MAEHAQKPIGGYFELEAPRHALLAHAHMTAFQSARAAFHALLRHGKPQAVWMPSFTCDAMLSPLAATGTEIRFYPLDGDLGVPASIKPDTEEWLVSVNYFGLGNEAQTRLAERVASDQLVFDHAQAFFCDPGPGLATVYSPRKFFGLPDGGLLATRAGVPVPTMSDDGSAMRCRHLLTRLGATPEAGYEYFRHAEAELEDVVPRRMSQLSWRLLESCDHETARRRRNENFDYLHRHLGDRNPLPIPSVVDGPMCYPLLTSRTGLRETLRANRVFVPTYWPEVRTRAAKGSFELALVDGCLPLPCDQRYGPADMRVIVDLILN